MPATLRTLYKGIEESIMLYGAPVWAHKINLTTYAENLICAQRTLLLTVGYRTLSVTLKVLVSVLPIDFTARMREELY